MSTSEEVSKKSCGGLTRNEVTNLMQPIAKLHGIEVKDDRLEFLGDHFCVETSESELAEETQTTVILYKDIVSISPFQARVEVLMQCGVVYAFSTTDSVKTHINTYSGGGSTKPEKQVTAQDVAGNIWDGLEKTLASGKKQG